MLQTHPRTNPKLHFVGVILRTFTSLMQNKEMNIEIFFQVTTETISLKSWPDRALVWRNYARWYDDRASCPGYVPGVVWSVKIATRAPWCTGSRDAVPAVVGHIPVTGREGTTWSRNLCCSPRFYRTIKTSLLTEPTRRTCRPINGLWNRLWKWLFFENRVMLISLLYV